MDNNRTKKNGFFQRRKIDKLQKRNLIISKNTVIDNYEKIGNTAYKMDHWSYNFFIFAGCTVLIILLILTSFFSKATSPDDIWFKEEVLPTIFFLSIIFLMIFLVLSVILQYIGAFYKKYVRYDKKEIIRLYLYELSNNPETSRKVEILKHLFFNLTRLEREVGSGFYYLRQYHVHWEQLKQLQKISLIIKVNTIDKIISFIRDAILFLDFEKYKDLLPKIGDNIKNNDYKGLNDILEGNKELFDIIQKEKDRANIKPKNRFKKFKSLIEWISVYGRNWISIIILLILMILYVLGIIKTPPTT